MARILVIGDSVPSGLTYVQPNQPMNLIDKIIEKSG